MKIPLVITSQEVALARECHCVGLAEARKLVIKRKVLAACDQAETVEELRDIVKFLALNVLTT